LGGCGAALPTPSIGHSGGGGVGWRAPAPASKKN